MTLILTLAHPTTDKERMFRLEAHINDLENPGKTNFVIDGKEYLMEIHYDTVR